MSTSPEFIVRCLQRDCGTGIDDLRRSAEYAESIGRGYALNPWADPSDSPAYLDAAKMLRRKADALTLELASAKRELERA